MAGGMQNSGIARAVQATNHVSNGKVGNQRECLLTQSNNVAKVAEGSEMERSLLDVLPSTDE